MAIECTEMPNLPQGLVSGAPSRRVAENLVEGLVAVGARLAGQAEDPLADDVPLDLVAAAGDRHDPAVEEVHRRRVTWLAVGPGDAPPARDLHRGRRPERRG